MSSTASARPSIPTVEEIRTRTLEAFKLSPCLWQCDVTQSILRGDKDVVAIAPTGSGKTMTFWMPLLFRPKGTVVVVTPLNILGAQNKKRLADLGIAAISVDAESATPRNLQDIESGAYRVVVINPEVAFRDKGSFERIWRSTTFTKSLICIIWDEAHCVSAWGSFRPHYTNAGRLRNIIPRSIPYLLPSATLPAHVLSDVLHILQIKRETTHIIRLSNDRPNIYLAVRKIQHSLQSFKDLNFLVPDDWKPGDKIRKFVAFFDNKTESIMAADYLRSRLPLNHRDKILWFNADNTSERRERSTEMLKKGELYGLTCTDAFGMGVDLKDIEIVVQWRCFCNLDTLWQRFGRAARGPGTEALVVLFAEAKYFDDEKIAAAQRSDARRRKADEKAAVEEQQKRKRSSTSNTLAAEAGPSKRRRTETPSSNARDIELSVYEGLRVEFKRAMPSSSQQGKVKRTSVDKELGPEMDAMINARWRSFKCHRAPIMAFYENDRVEPDTRKCQPGSDCVRCAPAISALCCELCWDSTPKPALRSNPFHILPAFDEIIRDGTTAPRASRVTKNYDIQPMDAKLQRALHDFRRSQAIAKYGPFAARNLSAALIMGDEIIQRIVDCARIHKITSIEDLQRETKWARSAEMGDEVIGIINEYYPQPVPKPPPDPPNNLSKDGQGTVKTARAVAVRSCKTCGATDHIASNRKCPGFDTYTLGSSRTKKTTSKHSAKPSGTTPVITSTPEATTSASRTSPSRPPLRTIASPSQSPRRTRIQDVYAADSLEPPIPFTIAPRIHFDT